jgi:glycosyltransferase involved in cell wall biosynthesis
MDMMKEFIARGWRVVALANEDENRWKEKFSECGIEYRQIYVQRNGVNPLNDLKTLRSIKTQLKDIRPQKIFAFQAKTVIYGAIAANQLGITEFYPLIAGMGSVFLEDDVKTRIVRKILTTEYKVAMRRCPAIFFQNHDDEDIFKRQRIIKHQKVVLIHGSGVNTEKFTVLPIPFSPTFLCISRLIRDKGVGEYLEAARKLHKVYPDIKCFLVGPYDTNPSAITEYELEEYVKDGSVEYFGETDDVRPFLAQSSVLVLPSYREGTPKTNLEAMACGRPVITTDAPGCKETVIDGENGWLVPVKDVDGIVEKMKWFIDHPDEIEKMGLRGRSMVESIFDVNKVNATICETMGL